MGVVIMRSQRGILCLGLMLAVGCGGTPPPKTAKEKEPVKVVADDHEVGPHGGTVADWGGGKYHIEFCVDRATKEATVYILGTDEKTPAPIRTDKLLLTITEPSFQVELMAKPDPKDPEGKASRFVGKHENLGGKKAFAGTVSTEIGEKPYAGDFKEKLAAK